MHVYTWPAAARHCRYFGSHQRVWGPYYRWPVGGWVAQWVAGRQVVGGRACPSVTLMNGATFVFLRRILYSRSIIICHEYMKTVCRSSTVVGSWSLGYGSLPPHQTHRLVLSAWEMVYVMGFITCLPASRAISSREVVPENVQGPERWSRWRSLLILIKLLELP